MTSSNELDLETTRSAGLEARAASSCLDVEGQIMKSLSNSLRATISILAIAVLIIASRSLVVVGSRVQASGSQPASPQVPATGAASQERGLKIRVGATSKDIDSSRSEVGVWAILIGVSRYQYGDQDLDGNRISNLKHAAEDSEAMRDFLRSPEGGAFREDHIVLLQDESATKQNVLSALARLKQAKPNDFFVIY